MIMISYDRTYAQIDLKAIRHNIMEVKKKVTDGTKVMAIVKANAYGHGAVPVAKALEDLVDAYGVAMIEEAVELRDAGLKHTILILGYTPESCYEEVVVHGISQTVYTYEMAKKISDVAAGMGKKALIHIKLDTGMGRIGFIPTEENAELVKKICELPGIQLEGMFTHFARADEESIEPAKGPLARYMWFVKRLQQLGVTIPMKHVANSAAIMGFSEAHLDCVRSGIITYGLYPSENVKKSSINLLPAMEWKSTVSYIKDIDKGTSIGYGGTFTAQSPMRVATIPVGYADGMKRDLSNKGRVLICGRYAPILGRICMDQFMVDVTHIPEVQIGEEVTIFGSQGEHVLSVEEVAGQAHSFNYEFVCNISGRVPRKYI